jgi:hypothetical protein
MRFIYSACRRGFKVKIKVKIGEYCSATLGVHTSLPCMRFVGIISDASSLLLTLIGFVPPNEAPRLVQHADRNGNMVP